MRFADEPHLFAVVECKAQVAKHESVDRDDYANYAVDGAFGDEPLKPGVRRGLPQRQTRIMARTA